MNILKLWIAYFLHELMQHVYSSPSFEKTVCSHRPQIWIAYFLLEQMQHVFSSHSIEKIYVHKLHIWMAYFHHELMKHVLLSYFFEKICSRKLHNWIARIKIKSTLVCPWTVVLNRKVVGLKARGLIWPIIYSDSIAMHRPSKQGLKVNLTMRIIESLS